MNIDELNNLYAEVIEELNERIELIEREYLIERDYADELPKYLEAMKMAIDALRKQEPMKPVKGSINPDKTQQYSCPNCGRPWWEWNFVTEYCDVCGQRIDLSDGGFAYTIDEVMAHIGIDVSTKSDFSPSDYRFEGAETDAK